MFQGEWIYYLHLIKTKYKYVFNFNYHEIRSKALSALLVISSFYRLYSLWCLNTDLMSHTSTHVWQNCDCTMWPCVTTCNYEIQGVPKKFPSQKNNTKKEKSPQQMKNLQHIYTYFILFNSSIVHKTFSFWYSSL